jgi:hypothetical protein
MSYPKINVNTLTGVQVTNSDTVDIPTTSNEGFLIYVGSTIPILQDITSGAGTPDPRYVNVKVLTVNNQDITFHNFKVGEYLPVQCKRIFATGTTAGVDCIAMS